MTKQKTRSFWVVSDQRWSFWVHKSAKQSSKMVLSIKPLPNDSDRVTKGKNHELQPRTIGNSGYFWDNYCRLHPILKVNRLLYLGKWTFVELHSLENKLEGNCVILDHRMHEGHAWIKAKRIRNRRNLRSSEYCIPAEVFGKKEPAKLAYYIFDNSLFLIDPAWEIGNSYFNWLSVEPLTVEDSGPKRKMPRRQKQVCKFTKL